MNDKKPEPTAEILANEGLPAVFVDNLGIATRADGMHFVQFVTSLPIGFREQFRMIIPDEKLKRMIDVLCEHLRYSPKKQKGGGKTRSK